MDGLIVSVPLKDKHARTFVVGRVILHDHRGGESGQELVDEKIIVRQLVVPMIRDCTSRRVTSSRIRSSVRLIAPRSKIRHCSQKGHRICDIPSIQGLSISCLSLLSATSRKGETGEMGEKGAPRC